MNWGQYIGRGVALVCGLTVGTAAFADSVQDYGANPSAPWRQKLAQLEQGENVVFRVLQLGDSHTAGGFFTDELRRRLQQRWGDGGIGWVFPQSVKGQRVTTVRYQNGWQTLDMRKSRLDFPLGGVVARSQAGKTLALAAAEARASADTQSVQLVARRVAGDGALLLRDGQGKHTETAAAQGWQPIAVEAALPVQFSVPKGSVWDIGAVGVENGKRGAVVSALGINGSQLSQWSAWRQDWQQDLAQTRADLVILAYGTNEAFNARFDPAAAETQWRNSIRRIRDTLPEAAVLIVGAPESLVGKQGRCGTRPAKLDAVQSMQKRVAESEGLLYWSWQQAQGGACSMNAWVKQGLAAKDGVHFNAEGYRRAAADLAQGLSALAQPVSNDSVEYLKEPVRDDSVEYLEDVLFKPASAPVENQPVENEADKTRFMPLETAPFTPAE